MLKRICKWILQFNFKSNVKGNVQRDAYKMCKGLLHGISNRCLKEMRNGNSKEKLKGRVLKGNYRQIGRSICHECFKGVSTELFKGMLKGRFRGEFWPGEPSGRRQGNRWGRFTEHCLQDAE